MVYVISQDGKPLMPCSDPIARLLLKQGKAKVKKREPFTIKLTYGNNKSHSRLNSWCRYWKQELLALL